jgi:hypothetical protein
MLLPLRRPVRLQEERVSTHIRGIVHAKTLLMKSCMNSVSILFSPGSAPALVENTGGTWCSFFDIVVARPGRQPACVTRLVGSRRHAARAHRGERAYTSSKLFVFSFAYRRDANLTYDVFGGAGLAPLATIAQIANIARIGSTASWGPSGAPVHLAGGHLPQGTSSWGPPGPGAAALARSSAAK